MSTSLENHKKLFWGSEHFNLRVHSESEYNMYRAYVASRFFKLGLNIDRQTLPIPNLIFRS